MGKKMDKKRDLLLKGAAIFIFLSVLNFYSFFMSRNVTFSAIFLVTELVLLGVLPPIYYGIKRVAKKVRTPLIVEWRELEGFEKELWIKLVIAFSLFILCAIQILIFATIEFLLHPK